jgi:hypothetical protein
MLEYDDDDKVIIGQGSGMGGLQGQHLEDVALPSSLLMAAGVRVATLREETDVRACRVDPVVPMKITFMDNGGKFNSYYVNS